MTNSAFGIVSMAACPNLPYEVARGPREVELGRRQPSRSIDILTISDNPALSVYLSGLFEKCGWTMVRVQTCEAGMSFLRENRAAVAVCDESLPDGFWHDAAAAFSSLPNAPALVVVSDDQSLVHEVLTLGGFDLLVRPLRESDVVWTVASAWHDWMRRFAETKTGVP